MAQVNQIFFSYREVAEALVKQEGIHEGWWGVYLEFGLTAANINAAPDADVTPAAIIPIQRIGLQRFEEANNLTVDAAEVNPAS
ncbi:MAG: hypothetical protein LC751_02095 [Actinobacteria bacterium]|nr:hypothetical protein [Actinomycetota bacterium]MCA1739424.1 hypothetical protein [Actinomycetota bacterium]